MRKCRRAASTQGTLIFNQCISHSLPTSTNHSLSGWLGGVQRLVKLMGMVAFFFPEHPRTFLGEPRAQRSAEALVAPYRDGCDFSQLNHLLSTIGAMPTLHYEEFWYYIIKSLFSQQFRRAFHPEVQHL
jgi:hypothetical protein